MATTTTPGEIAEQFDLLPDPRCHVHRLHPLSSVIAIAILAILAGSNGPTAIARGARVKQDLLMRGLRLPHGVPRKDVFPVVLSLLNPRVFQACFTAWLKALKLSATGNLDIDRPVLAIDGKTHRRSHDKAKGLGALHSVSAWASQLGLSLGQVACDDKSNEIAAIPELLRLIDLQGAIITIDALGTQKEIARQIVAAKADHVPALKGNQGTLHAAVLDYLGQHLDGDFAGIDARRHTVTETLHGKPETRFYLQFPIPKDLPMRDDWAGLKTIGVATRCYEKDGQECSDVRYYISSLAMGVQRSAGAARGHWSTENACHWTLGMTLREDDSRIRGRLIRENFAWLNRLALSLLKQHPSKDSIAMKRRLCGWDEEFLMEALTGIIP